jgi:hypothetical protein
MRRLTPIAFVLLLMLLARPDRVAGQSEAQATNTERAFVYGINAAIPTTYAGTFAPPSVDTIYLLAGETSIISPRMTEIYFWPITNEYKANWHALNEPVPGVLEVSANRKVVAELAPTDYTIHFTPQGDAASAKIFLGEEAVAADADFTAKQEAFHQASSDYYDAQQAWLDAADKAAAQQREGATPVALPPEPEPPAPIGVFSNGLNHGIPVMLEAGHYTIQLRGEDGQIVQGSERALTVFAARRTGAGYTVVPETRWTTPDESPAPRDAILGAQGSALYLEPHQAREYPARDWALLQNPQRAASDMGGWSWANGERLTEGQLEVLSGGDVVDRLDLTPFKVNQVSGSQLGYEVTAIDPAATSGSAPTTPDFEAYPIQPGSAGETFQIRMVAADGSIVPGSERTVSVPANPALARLLLLPAIPLIIGATVVTNRKRRVRLPHGVAG